MVHLLICIIDTHILTAKAYQVSPSSIAQDLQMPFEQSSVALTRAHAILFLVSVFFLLSHELSIVSFPGSGVEEPRNETRFSKGGTAIDSFPNHFLSSFVACK